MSILNSLASALGERSDVPNQELAKKLVRSGNKTDIDEIAQNLFNNDKKIQSDCIKVLYEMGYLAPELIAGYVQDFLKLLSSKNNRLVWGGMIALSTIAALKADEIYQQQDVILDAKEKGSVIATDASIIVLAKVAAAKPEYEARIIPVLLEHLRACRPKEVAQHSESSLVAINERNAAEFKVVLEKRMEDLTPAQIRRVNKVLKKIEY